MADRKERRRKTPQDQRVLRCQFSDQPGGIACKKWPRDRIVPSLASKAQDLGHNFFCRLGELFARLVPERAARDRACPRADDQQRLPLLRQFSQSWFEHMKFVIISTADADRLRVVRQCHRSRRVGERELHPGSTELGHTKPVSGAEKCARPNLVGPDVRPNIANSGRHSHDEISFC